MSHPAPPAWRLFWAKTDRDNKDAPDYDETWTRPLWAHLLDVAHTALLLWERAVPAPLRREAAAALGLPKQETEAGHLLSLWIGYHDLGKSIPSFQFEHRPTREKLKAAGLGFEKRERLHHGHATIALLHRLQREGGAGQSERRFWTHLGAFVGFHHGWLCSHSTWERHARGTDVLGGAAWAEAQAALHREVTAAWRARYPFPTPPGPFDAAPPDWLLGLAGWATYADWLGSNAPCFTREVTACDDLDGYLDESRAGAEKAIGLVGLDRPAPGLVAKPFGELFQSEDGQKKYKPNALQRLVLGDDFPAVSDVPTLTIIEAPTGEGKTEAALALVARQQAHERGGFYLALPTQATSNGLFGRAVRFLERAHADGPADFRLAHGNAQLHEGQDALWEDPTTLGGLSSDDGEPRDGDPRVRTLRWFVSPKRALLAPYGLGTVDQAMIGALRTRHFFLRLYGLAGKTVVIDEVHAYDLYMREIIGRLLGWLRALGCHVVLLSATLPARLRADLVRAWDPGAVPPAPLPAPIGTPYPAVWTVADGVLSLHDREGGVAIRAEQGQAATLRRHDETPEAVARTVAEAVQAGAVVGVILNTVARAQDVFEAIGKKVDLGPDDLVLFHARFLLRDRQKTEQDVVGYRDADTGEWVAGRFGKGRRGGPAVLVATQVAEQSLDLDVDLLLTDLAPIDLMLQRAGRLHRHARDDRPEAYAEPQVVWLCPDAPPDGLPEVKSKDVPFGFVYDPVVLWRTWRLLRRLEGTGGVGRWSLPGDYRELIETVYPFDETAASEPPPPAGLSDEARVRWQSAVKGGRQDMLGAVARAGDQCIPAPGDLFSLITHERSVLSDEDDGDAHETLRATTREGESVEVVVLHRDEGGALFLDADHETPAPLALPTSGKGLGREAVRAVLGASVRLSQTGLVHALRERPESEAPPEWRAAAKATPAIRHHHAVVLRGGVGKVSDWHIQSDARLGILVTKQS